MLKIHRRLGGGAQRPNREIVSFRSCVRARGDCQVEMSLKRQTAGFPFSLLAPGGFPFSLGILPLLPSCYPALAGFIGTVMLSACIQCSEYRKALLRRLQAQQVRGGGKNLELAQKKFRVLPFEQNGEL